jgi:hypothetical protein
MADDPAVTAFVAWLNDARGEPSGHTSANRNDRRAPASGAVSPAGARVTDAFTGMDR